MLEHVASREHAHIALGVRGLGLIRGSAPDDPKRGSNKGHATSSGATAREKGVTG